MNNYWLDKQGEIPIKEVTIQVVDQALFDFFDKYLKLYVNSPIGRKKVEVIFASGERWALLRKQNFRDNNGTIILPIISINQTSIDKTPRYGRNGYPSS